MTFAPLITRYFTIVGTTDKPLTVGPSLTAEEIIELAKETTGQMNTPSLTEAIGQLNTGDRVFFAFDAEQYRTQFLLCARRFGLHAEAELIAGSVAYG